MSDSMARKCVRHFNDGRENVHDAVVNEYFVRVVEQKIQENKRFTISTRSLHFSQNSRSLLHDIVSDKLRFRKLCSS
jgi:hypothetical protein